MSSQARYLLDTSILSELVKPRPDERVVAWVGAQSPLDHAISVLTLDADVRHPQRHRLRRARRPRL